MGKISKGLMDALNGARAEASEQYRNAVPELNADSSISSFAEPILDPTKTNIYNEFCNVLVQRIVYTQLETKLFKNKLVALEGDEMPLGYLGEEIFINPAIGRDYNINDFAGLLQKYEADVKVQYQEINFDKQYPVTIVRQKLKQAFVSWEELGKFITGLTNSLYNGRYIDEYNMTKGLVTMAYHSNAAQIQTVSAITSKATAEAFVEGARTLFLNFQDPSQEYNAWKKIGGYGRAIETFTDESDIIMLVRNDIRSKLDVNVLASAFNMDKADLMGRIYSVNNFDIIDRKTGEVLFDGSKIVGIICDKRWFRIKNQDNFMEEFRNPNNRSMNAYLNVIKMYKYNYFANAVIFATEQPSVAISSLKFYDSTKSINVGDEVAVSVVPTPFNATTPTIVYSSSNDSVATVEADSEDPNKCIITGVAAGTVTITATAGNVTTTMTVTVSNVNITHMRFASTSISAAVGTDSEVDLIVTPDNANAPEISYSSNNSDVFTVEADSDDPRVAVITPVGAGTGILTATAGEGASAITTTATVVVTGS